MRGDGGGMDGRGMDGGRMDGRGMDGRGMDGGRMDGRGMDGGRMSLGGMKRMMEMQRRYRQLENERRNYTMETADVLKKQRWMGGWMDE